MLRPIGSRPASHDTSDPARSVGLAHVTTHRARARPGGAGAPLSCGLRLRSRARRYPANQCRLRPGRGGRRRREAGRVKGHLAGSVDVGLVLEKQPRCLRVAVVGRHVEAQASVLVGRRERRGQAGEGVQEEAGFQREGDVGADVVVISGTLSDCHWHCQIVDHIVATPLGHARPGTHAPLSPLPPTGSGRPRAAPRLPPAALPIIRPSVPPDALSACRR